jgi:hypothetical protein
MTQKDPSPDGNGILLCGGRNEEETAIQKI